MRKIKNEKICYYVLPSSHYMFNKSYYHSFVRTKCIKTPISLTSSSGSKFLRLYPIKEHSYNMYEMQDGCVPKTTVNTLFIK